MLARLFPIHTLPPARFSGVLGERRIL